MASPKKKIVVVKKPAPVNREMAKSFSRSAPPSKSGRLGTLDSMSIGMDGKDIMPVSTKARTPIKPPKK